ncbi:MAG: hypothetical protein JNM68_16010 [Dinghuibacter sp.]|nr:hypothetical protein [Dinghuibacter sp.]
MKNAIKKTYICRDVYHFDVAFNEQLLNKQPEVGDVALFEVVSIGKHSTIQGDTKRNITILPGDTIMAAFGTRYATEQFEGYVPVHCNRDLHILGAGGTVGVVETMHQKFKSVGPTVLKFAGYATDKVSGEVINTKKMYEQQMVYFSGSHAAKTRIILSVGSSMDSGKTTSAAYLVRGLKKAGHSVAFIKLTGTVFTKDCDLNYDLGADMAVDFGSLGFPSTYMCSEDELLNLYESLVARVLTVQPEFVVMEIADGLYQRETKMLLKSHKLMDTVYAVLFSAGDSLSAINGINVLESWGIQPMGISGLLTASPLLIQEVKQNTTVPVYTLSDLAGQAGKIVSENTVPAQEFVQLAKAS